MHVHIQEEAKAVYSGQKVKCMNLKTLYCWFSSINIVRKITLGQDVRGGSLAAPHPLWINFSPQTYSVSMTLRPTNGLRWGEGVSVANMPSRF